MKANLKAKARILIVDDDYELLSDLKSMLEDYRYRVEINASMEIIDRLKHVPFDLICIDMMIRPSLSLNSHGEEIQNIEFANVNFRGTGLEFYRRLRAGVFNDSLSTGTPKDVPVIFISAISDNTLDEAVGNDHKALYLTKPFRAKELLELISTMKTIDHKE